MDGGIVALVDDYAAMLDSLRSLLEVEGFAVVAYASPTAFLADRSLRPACLIVDQQMPELTGLDLVAQLRREGSSIPVLLMSGLLPDDIARRAADLGIETVLAKPLDEDALLRFVRSHA